MTPEKLRRIKRRMLEWARTPESNRFNEEGRKLATSIIMEDTSALVNEAEQAFRAYATLNSIMDMPEVVNDPLLTMAIAKAVKDGLAGN